MSAALKWLLCFNFFYILSVQTRQAKGASDALAHASFQQQSAWACLGSCFESNRESACISPFEIKPRFALRLPLWPPPTLQRDPRTLLLKQRVGQSVAGVFCMPGLHGECQSTVKLYYVTLVSQAPMPNIFFLFINIVYTNYNTGSPTLHRYL